MGQKADNRNPYSGNKTHSMRKIVAIVVLGVVLLVSLLAVGYFGAKTLHRSHQRREAMAAYEKGDYERAEYLLQRYVQKDHNSEPEFVALADIYHKFGNTGMEAQMWQMASFLNPLNEEYWEKMLDTAAKSASYALLYGILSRKMKAGEKLTDRELYLFVISSYRTNYPKNGEEAYKKAVEADPEAFGKSDLGCFAEFLVKYSTMSAIERDLFLIEARKSEDSVVRFEAIYVSLLIKMAKQDTTDEELESLLKKLVETNYFSGTPIMADYDFAQGKFDELIALAEPYLKTVDSLELYLIYAESCVFTGKIEELRMLEKKLKNKTGTLLFIADYCGVLISFLENDGTKLAETVRKSGNIVTTPLSRFIRLRVAVEQGSFGEILTVARELFSDRPFHDIKNRALVICIDYLAGQMEKAENQNNPSRMAELANVLAGYVPDNNLLTQIIILDQYKKGVTKEADLLAAVEKFPEDVLLKRIAAEFLILEGKAEQALPLIEQILANGNDPRIAFLNMLALDQLGRHDEAATIFQSLVEQSEFDLNLLSKFFRFCWEHDRSADLLSMADKLENASDGMLKPFADFFRASALLLEDDEAKTQEALKLLAATPNDAPDFTLFAANRLTEADMLDEAEAKYKAIRNTYSNPSLILVNLSEIYKEKGKMEKALDAAKEAFDMEKKSMLPAFIYAKRLSEAERYEDAVSILNFPRRAVNYREDIVELWADCMKHVIEKSMADRRFLQAEEQCKHLLLIVPDDEFGKEKLEKVREILLPKKDGNAADDIVATPAA